MTQADWTSAMSVWRERIGAGNVLDDPSVLSKYSANVSGLSREIKGVLKPGSTEEVRQVVRVANEYRTPLYPISTGMNWGLGSALPVRDYAAIVDLSRMNVIHEVSSKHLYAEIEPGVTQLQLYDYINKHDLPVMFNVTGSAAGTSLIGNSLERGIGYFSSRASSLWSLEIVSGAGEIIRTGFGHFENSAAARHYPYGVGPSIDGLFFQGNCGIVTRAVFGLMPKPEKHAVIVCKLRRDEDLERFVDRLCALRRRGVLESVVHIGNRHRQEIALGKPTGDHNSASSGTPPSIMESEGFGDWSALVGLAGDSRSVRSAAKAVRGSVKGMGKALMLNDRRLKLMRMLVERLDFIPCLARKKPLMAGIMAHYGLCKGIPTDETLKSLYWAVGEKVPPHGPQRPDDGSAGMIYCLPVIPASGDMVRETVRLAEEVFSAHSFAPYITVNLVDERVAECVINVAFDRSNTQERERAQKCMNSLYETFVGRGIIPYRVGIEAMHHIVNEKDAYWRAVRDIKKVFDPRNIIAPGRYNLI